MSFFKVKNITLQHKLQTEILKLMMMEILMFVYCSHLLSDIKLRILIINLKKSTNLPLLKTCTPFTLHLETLNRLYISGRKETLTLRTVGKAAHNQLQLN